MKNNYLKIRKLLLFCLLAISFYSVYSHDYIKFSSDGSEKKTNSKKWSCVLDKKTNLLWEVKKIDNKIQNPLDTYTWFDGKTGVANGKHSNKCYLSSYCNTNNYINIINSKKLCGYSSWRLPTVKEIISIRSYSKNQIAIDKFFFPNTQAGLYWTSNESTKNPNVIWDIPFFYGGSSGSDKKFNSYIRLVTDANKKNK